MEQQIANKIAQFLHYLANNNGLRLSRQLTESEIALMAEIIKKELNNGSI